MIDNIETSEIMGQMQEEVIRACEPFIDTPNTSAEQEKIRQQIQHVIMHYPIHPIEQIYIDVKLA